MVHGVLELGEPPGRDLGEDLSLERNGLGKDHIEGAHPVTGHHEEHVGAGFVDVPDLPLAQKGEGKVALVEWGGSCLD